MAVEAFLQALQNFRDLDLLLFMFVGSIIGIVFGLIPAIGSLTAMALIIPFTFMMPPMNAIPLLLALTSGAITAGSITSILLNIPGTGVNVATLIDGFPMNQKGQAGRALGAALVSSGMGGVFSVFLAFAIIPLVLPMVMALRSADMVFVILLGITFIGVLGTGSTLKGLISGGIGLLISFIGYQASTGASRFTFGANYLYDGIPLLPVILGIFGLPEMITLAAKGGAIAKAGANVKGVRDIFEGGKDVFRHFFLWMRSTILGYIIGIVPGVGASVAQFVAYGQARQTSRHPQKFGTGTVEGVIAPESANNAVQGGALLTMLALGIPGSPDTAILLGALLLMNVIPGPQMMTAQLDLSLTLLLIVIGANIIAASVCLILAPNLAKVAYIPGRILVPLVIAIIFIGAYVHRESLNDVVVTIAFGIVGLAMRNFGFSRPSLLLGLILGTLFEHYLFLALAASGPLFFVRPISLVLIVISIAAIFQGQIRGLFGNRFRRQAKTYETKG
ncbi:MAG: tripartite tricarboxylate transporter permease [Chloroflexi bacterium]|nr:tripartite tricarboxylate transporter permease [Chloroflexota bacterium]